jgi:hypothetical protein
MWFRKKLNPERMEADKMRVISLKKITSSVYEIVTESKKHGRVTQRVLVLLDSPVEGRTPQE